MHAKTMEGLAGASASIQMLSTPMNVAKEAERKGDIDKMKRAMSYAAGLTEQAGEYSQKSKTKRAGRTGKTDRGKETRGNQRT